MKPNMDRATRIGLLVGLISFLTLGAVGGAYLHYLKASNKEFARGLSEAFAMHITARANEVSGPVFMLASVVKQNNGSVPQFDQLAADLILEFPLVRAVELAPAGVVRQVYPLRGNEAIIGHDLLADKGRNKQAHIAVAKRQLTVAGPFQLIQGGLGAVARYPVFMQDRQGKSAFWGFAIVLFHLDELLANAGAMELDHKGLRYQICKVSMEPDAEPCKRFGGAPGPDLVDAVERTIELPNTQWRLFVGSDSGWVSLGKLLGVVLLVVGGALLTGFASWRSIRQSTAED